MRGLAGLLLPALALLTALAARVADPKAREVRTHPRLR
jgi:hypothetical protein